MRKQRFRNIALVVLFLTIVFSPVTVVSGLLGLVEKYEIFIAFLVFLLTLILVLGRYQTFSKIFLIIILIQLVFLLAHSFVHRDYVGNFAFIVKLVIMPVLFMTLGFIGHAKVADLFVRLILFLSCLAFLQFLLIMLDLNFLQYRYNDVSGHAQIFYGFSNSTSVSSFGGMMMPRQGSFFFEPGAFAFFIFAAITLNMVFKLPTKREYYLLLFGSVSFSLYYFLILILYCIFKINLKRLLIALSIIFILNGLYYSFGKKDSSVDKVLGYANRVFIERLLNIDKVNNRIPGYTETYHYFVEYPFMGAGRQKSTNIRIRGSGYIRFLGMFGIFGALILASHIGVTSYVVYKTKRLSYQKRAFILIGLILMLLHREHVMQLIAYCYYFLVYAGSMRLHKNKTLKTS
jgi:hypothetical protein